MLFRAKGSDRVKQQEPQRHCRDSGKEQGKAYFKWLLGTAVLHATVTSAARASRLSPLRALHRITLASAVDGQLPPAPCALSLSSTFALASVTIAGAAVVIK
jgi:hypothetical protein